MKLAKPEVPERYVMEPSALTRFLIAHLRVRPGMVAVDLGCGSGALAIAAVQRGASRCWAVDLNSDAVYATYMAARQQNISGRILPLVASIDEVEKIIPESIDLVIANPPQLPRFTSDSARSKRDMAYNGGPTGRDYVDLVITKAAQLLRDSNVREPELYFVTTSVVDLPATLTALERAGFESEILAQREEPFRPVYFEQMAAIRPELYTIRNGTPFETLYILRGRLQQRCAVGITNGRRRNRAKQISMARQI